MQVVPKRKIQVFLSSNLGGKDNRYNEIRDLIKEEVEKTGIAQIYVFEQENSSTFTTEEHYIFGLRESNVCIFLIDNADGVNEGTQKEIDEARKLNKKSLFYFCDENSKKETAIQKSLKGVKGFKYSIISSFDDFLKHSITGLIEDIINVYIRYCNGTISTENINEKNDFSINNFEQENLIKKDTLANTDKCKNFFNKMFMNINIEIKNTNQLDELSCKFIDVLFNNKNISDFNTSLFLQEIEKIQSKEIFEITKIRWNAIQAYLQEDMDKCVTELANALKRAKELNLADWIIKDILIDYRNYIFVKYDVINAIPRQNEGQDELDASNGWVYYPVIDRLNYNYYESIYNEYLKIKFDSPYSVTLGYNIPQVNTISDLYLISLFYGSLTHIEFIHKHILKLAIFLANKFDYWPYKLICLKEAIFLKDKKQVDSLCRIMPELVTLINHKEAEEIIQYCNNNVLKHNRFKTKIIAMSKIGYVLDDNEFEDFLNYFKEEINQWFKSRQPNYSYAEYIFMFFRNNCYRIDLPYILDVCELFIDKNYRRWYEDIYKLLKYLVSKLDFDNDIIDKLNRIVIRVFDTSFDSYEFRGLLIRLRKQFSEQMKYLDLKIEEKDSTFYNDEYLLEIEDNMEKDLNFIGECIKRMESQIETQGKNGVYTGYSTNPISEILNIILLHNLEVNDKIKEIYNVCYKILCSNNQTIIMKCRTLELLMLLFIIDKEKIKLLYLESSFEFENIRNCSQFSFERNISENVLEYAFYLFMSLINTDYIVKMYGVLPYLYNDIPSLLEVSYINIRLMDLKDDYIFDNELELFMIQNIISCLGSPENQIKCNGVYLLLLLGRNDRFNNFKSEQLINIVDNGSLSMKLTILKNIKYFKIDDETRKYIIDKFINDNNYKIRQLSRKLELL